MQIPPKAKSNLQESMKSLEALEAGKALHYCIVRVAGADDADARVVFGEAAMEATKESFLRAWADDPVVSDSDRPKWQVARGAVVATPDGGYRTYPALRGNQVLSSADVKTEFKAVRESLTKSGVQAAPLKKVLAGKFERAMDTSTFDGEAGSDGLVDDEADMRDTAAGTSRVKQLVADFKLVPLRQAVTAGKDADSEDAKQLALVQAEQVRSELARIEKAALALAKELRSKLLGAKRHKDSLKTLDELVTRCRAGERTLETELGFLFAADAADADNGGKTKKGDKIIETIRTLVGKVNASKDADRRIALADLYFATELWLKSAGGPLSRRAPGHVVDTKLEPKVREVFTKTAHELAKLANVTINNLPSWLEENYGKGMEKHGTKLDVDKELAWWMTDNQRDLFRCHVEGGKLRQYLWWEWNDEGIRSLQGRLPLEVFNTVPVDSANFPSEDIITPGYTGFVLSMGNDIYLRHQTPDAPGRSTYHSSYMAGLPVKMAGEMLVKNGEIEVVNTRSGHYQPGAGHVAELLRTFEMMGLKVRYVASHEDDADPIPVADFLKAFGHLRPDPEEYRRNERAMAEYRQEIFFKKLFAPYAKQLEAFEPVVSELERILVARDEQLIRMATATTTEKGRYKVLAGYQTRAAEEKRPGVEALVGPLNSLRVAIEAKLEERNKSNLELRTKSGEEEPETEDAYVLGLRRLSERSRDVQLRINAALKRMVTEPTVPEEAPWDLPHHGGLPQEDAERLLIVDGKWLLRHTDGGWVISSMRGWSFSHTRVRDMSREEVLDIWKLSDCVRP